MKSEELLADLLIERFGINPVYRNKLTKLCIKGDPQEIEEFMTDLVQRNSEITRVIAVGEQRKPFQKATIYVTKKRLNASAWLGRFT